MTKTEFKERAEKLADRLAALVPMMREDAECHRTWTTEAARKDLDGRHFSRPVVDVVGDAEWHARWTKFYDDCADVMQETAALLREPIE
jgi:hemoglobin-like flavoprotein